MSDNDHRLERLWQAIVDHTKDDDMFWIGETLLDVLRDETGYMPPRPVKGALRLAGGALSPAQGCEGCEGCEGAVATLANEKAERAQ